MPQTNRNVILKKMADAGLDLSDAPGTPDRDHAGRATNRNLKKRCCGGESTLHAYAPVRDLAVVPIVHSNA